VEHTFPIGSLLAVGTALVLIAPFLGWRPKMGVSLVSGAALRLAVLWLAATLPQSWDFANDFAAAGAAVLHHTDPVLNNPGRWHILPLMPFMLAAELKIGQFAHVSWPLIGKLAPVVADLALIPLVGRLAGRRGRLAAFQYACNPVSIMVCAVHGQLEPVSLALGVGAFLVARSGRAKTAGLLGGLSAATGGWPVLLLPGILLALPASRRPAPGGSPAAAVNGERAVAPSPQAPPETLLGAFRTPWGAQWRQWISAAVCAALVPALLLVTSPLTVGTPIGELPHVARLLIGARSIVGDWGWTAIVTGGVEQGDTGLARVGKVVLILALLATLYLWRRADPLRLTTALLLVFLVATPRLGVQYLIFPIPFLVALGGPAAAPSVVASAAWQGAGYLYLPGLTYTGWLTVHRWWALSSLAVIGCLIAAMPWAQRNRQRTDIDATSRDSRVLSPAARPAGQPGGASGGSLDGAAGGMLGGAERALPADG
jgi:hypothetical protein